MSVDNQEFRLVLHGYEPAEVDALRQALLSQFDEALANIRPVSDDASITLETPADSFGKRLTKILSLAEEEASEIRGSAAARAEELRSDVEITTTQLRKDADEYATNRTDEAESFASKLVTDTEAKAAEMVATATSEAAAMREAASTVLDEQKAKAADIEATFERHMESEREKAETKLRAVLDDHQVRMHDLDELLETRRVEGERRHQDALAAARSILEDAHTRADGIVAEATATAESIRVDGEKEVAVISKQRDEINAQLSNVREMLASLTGGSIPAAPIPAPAE